MRTPFVLFIVIILVLSPFVPWAFSADDDAPQIGPAKARHRSPGEKFTAIGTVEPEQVVDIGSQVSGTVASLRVDHGSAVEKGDLLALVDDRLYKATVDQNAASINLAKANLLVAKANQSLAQTNMRRDEELLKTKGALPPTQYDTDVAELEVVKAIVAVKEAEVQHAEATLRTSQFNLDCCTITSPIKGVVIDRRINVGQIVISNLSSSSLFLVATDFEKLQVWASVNETDIGQVHRGQHVRFAVDAYPGEEFEGEVKQIRLNATMLKEIVTYTVVVAISKPKKELLPYMTAHVDFE